MARTEEHGMAAPPIVDGDAESPALERVEGSDDRVEVIGAQAREIAQADQGAGRVFGSAATPAAMVVPIPAA